MNPNSYIGKRINQIIFVILLVTVFALSALSYKQTYEFFVPAFVGDKIWAHLMAVITQYGPTALRILAYDMRESKVELSGALFAAAFVLEIFDAGTNVAWYVQEGKGPKWENAQWFDIVRDVFVGALLILVTQSEEMFALLLSKILDFETEIRGYMKLPVPEWMKWADRAGHAASTYGNDHKPSSPPPPPNRPAGAPPQGGLRPPQGGGSNPQGSFGGQNRPSGPNPGRK